MKIDFKADVLTIAVDSGSVVVDYTVTLETDTREGPIARDQASVFNADIEEAVEKLSALVVDELRRMSGLGPGEETPLDDIPAHFRDEEEEL